MQQTTAHKDKESEDNQPKEQYDRETGLPLLSASRLKSYIECPKSYKYKYLYQGQEKPSIYSINGSALHRSLELLYKENTNKMKTYIERMEKWRGVDVISGDQYLRLYAEGLQILKTYKKSWYKPMIIQGKPVIERHFKLKYPNDEEPIAIIRGYIDLTQKNSFVDWKSSKAVLSAKKISQDLQFLIYYWSFNRIYNRYPDYGVYHRLPDHKRIIVTDFDLSILDTAIKKFITDPMEYDMTPCEKCSFFCSLRQLDNRNINHAIR